MLELPKSVSLKADACQLQAHLQTRQRVEGEVLLRMEGPRLSVYKVLNTDDKDEADVILRVNLMKELGVSQHNMCSCSVTTVRICM